MRLLTDIPIARSTIRRLQRDGHDVIAVADRLPPTSTDEVILDLAIAEQRVVICFDLDFANLVALSGRSFPSVDTLRTSQHRAECVEERLAAVLPSIAEELADGVLATIEDHRVRLRNLPLPGKP